VRRSGRGDLTPDVISGRGWGRLRAGLVVPIVGLAGLAAIALQGPPPASAASACPGRNGQVAVSVGTRSGSQVLGVVTSGRRVRKLFGSRHVPQEAVIGSPSYSCDGAELVYSVDNESGCDYLEVLAVASGKRRQLETPHLCDDNPAFFADGRIIFDARHGTYVIDADGLHLTHLFGEGVLANTADGRWFIAAGHRTLYLLDSKGRRVRRLVPILPARGGEFCDHASRQTATGSSMKRPLGSRPKAATPTSSSCVATAPTVSV
jgi:hypothetical protein